MGPTREFKRVAILLLVCGALLIHYSTWEASRDHPCGSAKVFAPTTSIDAVALAHPPTALSPSDVVVGVLTTRSMHDTRAIATMEEWGNDQRLGETGSVVFVTDGRDNRFPTVVTPCASTYTEGMACKTLHMFDHFLEALGDRKWFMRAMDDTHVNVTNLLQFLGRFDPNVEIFIGHAAFYHVNPSCELSGDGGVSYKPFFKEPPRMDDDGATHVAAYPEGGCGWIVSRAALSRIVSTRDHFLRILRTSGSRGLDDVAFGLWMREVGVPMLPVEVMLQEVAGHQHELDSLVSWHSTVSKAPRKNR